MKILIIASEIPYRKETKKGIMTISMQSRGIIEELAKQGHKIYLQLIFNQLFSKIYQNSKMDTNDEIELKLLKDLDIEILEPIYSKEYSNKFLFNNIFRFLRIILKKTNLQDFYPALKIANKVNKIISNHDIKIAISLASKEGVASLYLSDIDKIDWHGDMDHFGLMGTNIIKNETYDRKSLKLSFKFFLKKILKYDYKSLEESKKNESYISKNFIVAHSTYSNMDITKSFGNFKTYYTGNPVRDYSLDKIQKNFRINHNKLKIIGQIGNLETTGRYFAMKYLIDKLYPLLNSRLKEKFEIFLYSSYNIPSYFEKFADNKNVILSGWVEDITSELKSADIILILENTGPFIAAQTKHIVSLSMGLCMVLHKNSKQAIPELIDGFNCLMGETPLEIVNKIEKLMYDKDLKTKIKKNARLTYEKYFTPKITAKKIIEGYNLFNEYKNN